MFTPLRKKLFLDIHEDHSAVVMPIVIESPPASAGVERSLALPPPASALAATAATFDSKAWLATPALPNRAATVCGLNNMGNTCYMNAVVQCLRHLPGFVPCLRRAGPAPSSASLNPTRVSTLVQHLSDVSSLEHWLFFIVLSAKGLDCPPVLLSPK